MARANLFQNQLDDLLNHGTQQELFSFIDEYMHLFFSSPHIPTYYRMLKHMDLRASSSLNPHFLMAWLSFLSGDHPNFFSIMKGIRETDLSGSHESSSFYCLKAMMGYMLNPKEGLKYAKLAIDILPPGEESFYLANAQLTYGQLLAGSDQYRAAAELFASSYNIFYSLELHFLAIVALVNESLNLYKLGEFHQVIEKCNHALLMGSSFKDDVEAYLNVVYLPLGMCYYELNRIHLAIDHLKMAKTSIDQFSMFHMHGMIELYLFKCYYIQGDQLAMEALKNDVIQAFGHMHYQQMDLLISMFRILSNQPNGIQGVEADVEKFELLYVKDYEKSPSIVIETLALLRIMGCNDLISMEALEKHLDFLRYIGIIPRVQGIILYLAELYFMEDKQEPCLSYLSEAVEIYKDYGISVNFYTLPLKSIELIQKIDKNLYLTLSKKKKIIDSPSPSSILSSREKEILQWISMGKTNEEISKGLYISVGTIKWHINNIFGKLEVKNRVQAIEKAKSMGEL